VWFKKFNSEVFMATKKAPQTTATSGAAAAPALAPVTAAPKKRSTTKKSAAEAAAPAPKKAAAKKVAPVAAKAEPVIAFTMLQDEIRTEAYSYFIQREYRTGDPTADWHRAEETVLRRYGLR
jgi:hypothetical protein